MTVHIEDLDGHTLSVTARGVELFRYVYRPAMPAFEGPKPYLHPVRTLAGDTVTAYRPHDHRWHKGVQFTASHVSGQNFWGGGSYVRDRGYADLPNIGAMRHDGFDEVGGGRFAERLSWYTQAGEHWASELRELAVGDVEDDSWALGFATAVTNTRGETLEFGSPTTHGRPAAGYTGLFWRGPRAFTGGDVTAADGRGGPEMMGRPARWLAYSGHHDEVDRSATLLFFDDPDHAALWFVRDTPFAAVNPSFAFDQEIALPPGGTLRRRYRIVVADGRWDRERLEAYSEEHPW
jgi:hypothetical protein